MQCDSEDLQEYKDLTTRLRKHGFEINIGACGCCDSPAVTVWHNNKLIFDQYEADLKMKDDPETVTTSYPAKDYQIYTAEDV